MKKLLTLLLTALLLLGSLPISALAQENGGSDALTGDYVPGEAIVCVKDTGFYGPVPKPSWLWTAAQTPTAAAPHPPKA